MNGDPVQISMHSNLIYSAFDPRFNVVSLPFLFDSVEDADAKLEIMKEQLASATPGEWIGFNRLMDSNIKKTVLQ
jgi:TRAP-type C4-dicarboxylate transport system substrate-binding protein